MIFAWIYLGLIIPIYCIARYDMRQEYGEDYDWNHFWLVFFIATLWPFTLPLAILIFIVLFIQDKFDDTKPPKWL